ncbi:MAG: PD-(D/E)XK nuclease family transposase [Acidobacteria bacterium]|nr:PD-(D/E)XK nuclease family transposase [Acidobacteriota bacterium]
MTIAEKYLNPFTDFGFKKLFGSEPNKDLLIDFLNQLLPQHHQIQDLSFTPNEMLGDTKVDRRAVFDLFCMSQSGERFIVEMQKAKQNYFKDRSVFYSTFPIREQAERRSDWDFKLSAVYLVGVLDFVFAEDKNSPEVLHYVQLKDQGNRVFYDKLTFIYLEMPKFNKTEAELMTSFDKWLYVLKRLPALTDRPVKLQERIFAKLFEIAEVGNFTREELAEYENSLKNYRDLKNVIDTAVDDAKVIERRASMHDVARRGLADGFPLAAIARLTGLSEEEIEALRQS